MGASGGALPSPPLALERLCERESRGSRRRLSPALGVTGAIERGESGRVTGGVPFGTPTVRGGATVRTRTCSGLLPALRSATSAALEQRAIAGEQCGLGAEAQRIITAVRVVQPDQSLAADHGERACLDRQGHGTRRRKRHPCAWRQAQSLQLHRGRACRQIDHPPAGQRLDRGARRSVLNPSRCSVTQRRPDANRRAGHGGGGEHPGGEGTRAPPVLRNAAEVAAGRTRRSPAPSTSIPVGVGVA